MISVELVLKMLLKKQKNLSTGKATQSADLPVKVLNGNSDTFGNYICHFFSDCVDRRGFQSILKIANIALVSKKGDRDFKDNYRLVSILPVISKILEKLLC